MAFDIVQAIATLGAGITGTLGTIRLIRFVASRRADPDENAQAAPRPNETVKEYKDRLFPNGEKDQIFKRIDELAQADRDNNRSVIALESGQRSFSKTLEDIEERLAEHVLMSEKAQARFTKTLDDICERMAKRDI